MPAVSYWTYYAMWFFASYALRQPMFLAGIVAFLVFRPFIPDPTALWRAFQRIGPLRRQVEINSANVTARRDLAFLYLDLLRPAAALEVLDQALVRAPDDAELLYLSGVALHRSGRNKAALERLIKAVERSPRVRFGMAYRVAGDALMFLKRWDEAIDAYQRYLDVNSSDVGAYLQLAQAHAHANEHDAAKATIAEGLKTFRVLPGGLKRRSIGAWLRLHWTRVTGV